MSGTITIDLSSSVPAYRQIADALRAQLVAGELQTGMLLPPVRQLAIDLGVHFNTVAEAYRILAEEGWLDLKRRRGAMVIERTVPAPQGAEQAAAFTRRLRELVAEVLAAGLPPGRIGRELKALAEVLDK